MLKKLNKSKIINEINTKGFSVVENFYNTKDLNYIKESLRLTLDYIEKSSEKDLQKKYYEIKKKSPILKSHFYDISPHNINIMKMIHNDEILGIVRAFFKTDVLFSGRPAIHVHDKDNDKLLMPHQETNQFARDILLFWCPLWDTNINNGGLTVYPFSHKGGYLEHNLEHPKLGNKSWTKNYTHIKKEKLKGYKKVNLNIKAGSVVLAHSALIHAGYPLKDKKTVRIVITERFNPLDKIPFLKKENSTKNIPYTGIDYNKIIN